MREEQSREHEQHAPGAAIERHSPSIGPRPSDRAPNDDRGNMKPLAAREPYGLGSAQQRVIRTQGVPCNRGTAPRSQATQRRSTHPLNSRDG
jgi:hypothetical protein